jgi:hypothetical protein
MANRPAWHARIAAAAARATASGEPGEIVRIRSPSDLCSVIELIERVSVMPEASAK